MESTSLYGEYVVRYFLPDGVFSTFGHGLDSNLYPPGVWFADAMAFFLWCCVCFLKKNQTTPRPSELVLLRFSSMLSLKPRPSFNRLSICRRFDNHTCLFYFFPFSFFFCLFGDVAFSGVFFPLSLYGEYTAYVISFRMFFLLCDNGLDF